jgi:hypothetical protein
MGLLLRNVSNIFWLKAGRLLRMQFKNFNDFFIYLTKIYIIQIYFGLSRDESRVCSQVREIHM